MGLKESGLRGSIRNVSTGIGAAISIDTLEAENVEADSATIRGEITEITNFGEDAELFFEWGEITEGLPNTTDIQLQDTVGVFTEDLTNLSQDTSHEFQAFGSVRDVSDDGVVLTFETDAGIPDSGLTHEYLFDEGSGDLLADNVGSLDATRVGPDWLSSEGEGGFYLDFNRSEDDYVEIGDHGSLGSEFVIASWIKPDTTTGDLHIARKGTDGSDQLEYIFRVSDGELDALVVDDDVGVDSITGGSIVTNDWQMVTLTRFDGVLSGYIDKTEVATTASTRTIRNGDRPALVGARDLDDGGDIIPEDEFDGGIDAPRYWLNRGFNSNDVSQLFDETVSNYE